MAPLHVLQSPYNLFKREIESGPTAAITGLPRSVRCAAACSPAVCTPTRHSTAVNSAGVDPKFQLPRFARYLAALAGQLRSDEMHMIADFLGVPE